MFTAQLLLIFYVSYCILIRAEKSKEKITYFSLERPYLLYFNERLGTVTHYSAKRLGRNNPVYYSNVQFTMYYSFGNNVSVDIYFYEFLTNRYHRSFVEMHFTACELVKSDFFGPALRQGNFLKPCPFPAGDYSIANATIPLKAIPRGFPFNKGRIYANCTITKTKERVFEAHIDMELKQMLVADFKSGYEKS